MRLTEVRSRSSRISRLPEEGLRLVIFFGLVERQLPSSCCHLWIPESALKVTYLI